VLSALAAIAGGTVLTLLGHSTCSPEPEISSKTDAIMVDAIALVNRAKLILCS
jgi:hypothetical protein